MSNQTNFRGEAEPIYRKVHVPVTFDYGKIRDSKRMIMSRKADENTPADDEHLFYSQDTRLGELITALNKLVSPK